MSRRVKGSRRGFLAGGSAAALSMLARRGPAAGAVEVGLERLAGESRLRGRRVGLVAHGASVTVDGRHAIDVMRGLGIDVRRLFAPEHGLRGRAAAGKRVESGVDEASRLPVVSLYGAKNRPEPADLAALDVLVFDLQDAGVRFYTYSSTMLLCLEAAAEAGLEFVVLDRPNPLGGERVAGPLSDPPELVPRTLVNTAPGPLVHGLTAGELARFANARRQRPARLDVVAMAGWRRDMTWAATGRPWPVPSPNLRSAEAALAYPGTCLVEGTNVSEGRGSQAPFLLIGAPWLDPAALARAVAAPGFALEPARFTPEPSEAAPEPKHRGEPCAAVRVQVTDPGAAAPYALGVALLRALKDHHPEFAWRGDGSGFDRLVGTRRLRAAIDRGDAVAAILAADAAAHEAFRRERREALLY